MVFDIERKNGSCKKATTRGVVGKKNVAFLGE